MAGKTPTELYKLIRNLEVEITRLTERHNLHQRAIDVANLGMIREQLAVLRSAVERLEKRCDEAEKRNELLAVLASQFAEFKKHAEEKDRRWWQFWVGAGLVGLTFVANLMIQLFLLFSRKPG